MDSIIELQARVAKLEARIDVLTRGLQLTLVAAKPASEWIDANMAKIDAEHKKPTPL